MYQHLTIVGNLGRDVELRYLPNGNPVSSMSVATSNNYTNGKGEQVKETTWFRVSIFGKQAENCNQYLSKGSKVLVEGRLRADPATGGPRLYTGNDGVTRSSFEMTANVVKFLSSKNENASNDTAKAGANENLRNEVDESGFEADDLPFE
jgi:single-strand DNA-binding protein